jgi:membrane protein implicated in regulation of membrane protease activity
MITAAVFGWFAGLSYWKWLLAGLALLGVEMFTGTTYLLWAGLAALLTGVVTLGFADGVDGLDWRVQIGVFAAICFVLVIAGRRVLRPFWAPPASGSGAP